MKMSKEEKEVMKKVDNEILNELAVKWKDKHRELRKLEREIEGIEYQIKFIKTGR
jgi:hypothetical protein